MEEINKEFGEFPLVMLARKKIGLKASYIVILYLILALGLSLFNLTGNSAVIITGILYPGYKSMNAVNSREIEDDKQWLSYWVLFSGVNFLDYAVFPMISQVPFYYTLKLLLVIYLFWPSTRGSIQIYEKYLYPMISHRDEDESARSSFDTRSKLFKED